MEEVDRAFAQIKHSEGISDIGEIMNSLVRIIEKKYQVYWKMYEISNVTQKYIAENEWLTKHNEEMQN